MTVDRYTFDNSSFPQSCRNKLKPIDPKYNHLFHCDFDFFLRSIELGNSPVRLTIKYNVSAAVLNSTIANTVIKLFDLNLADRWW